MRRLFSFQDRMHFLCKLGIPCQKVFFLAVLNLILAALVNPTHAGVVTWQTVQAIAGDSDVDNTGTLVYAYNFGPNAGPSQVQTVTVSGVNFQAFGAPIVESYVQSITIGDVILSEDIGELNGFDTSANSGSFASLSSPYKGLLGTAIAASYYATMTLTLGGLDAGNSYRVQLWVNDSKKDILYNRVQIGGDGSNTEVKTNVAGTVGAIGQYVIGTFTATGSSQQITFVGLTDVDGINFVSRNPIVNAFQLRLESSGQVPEPTSITIFGLGALGFAYQARRKRSKE
jgi:hypothetical protein